MVTRILHFSDVHFDPLPRGIRKRDLIGKRGVALVNLILNRRRYFLQAERKVSDLLRVARAEDVDAILCTGDYTAFGTENELAHARAMLQPFVDAGFPVFSLPGNHDLYLADSARAFIRHFSDLEKEGDALTFPKIDLVGEDVAIVRINSALPHISPLDSSGYIPDTQLAALVAVAERDALKNRFVVIATHYAPRTERGKPDHARHGLKNADALLEASKVFDNAMICHGHIHHTYQVRVPETPHILSCAGSATLEGREGSYIYEVANTHALRYRRLRWGGEEYNVE